MGISITAKRPPGRPSRFPSLIRYHDTDAVAARLEEEADKRGMTVAQFQRVLNRTALEALSIRVE